MPILSAKIDAIRCQINMAQHHNIVHGDEEVDLHIPVSGSWVGRT